MGLHAPHTSFSLQAQGSCNSPIVTETQQSHREKRSRASESPRHHAFPPLEPSQCHGSSRIGPDYKLSWYSPPKSTPTVSRVCLQQRAGKNTPEGVLAYNSHRMKVKTFPNSLILIPSNPLPSPTKKTPK